MSEVMKLTLAEVKSIVEREGLGYAVQDYVSYGNIADEALAAAWKRAEIALADIDEILTDVEPG